MKSILIVLIIVSSCKIYAQPPISSPVWQVVFEDDFNDDVIDVTKWKVAHFMGPNPDSKVFVSDNVREDSGALIITVINDSIYCPISNTGFSYAITGRCQGGEWYGVRSGGVATLPAHDFKYGYMEASIDMEFAPQINQGFWTFRQNNPPPLGNANEIDIVEASTAAKNNAWLCYDPTSPSCTMQAIGGEEIPGSEPYLYNFNPFKNGWNPITDPPPPVIIDNPNFFGNGYHKYAVLWTPDQLIYYYDDKIVRTVPNPGFVRFAQIFLSVGTGFQPFPEDQIVTFETKYDYVKVYQLVQNCEEVYDVCSFPFSSYTTDLKSEITIGINGGNCPNVQPLGTSTFLDAVNGITLHGPFEVPVGSEFQATTSPCY